MERKSGLTSKQQRFCQEYLVDLNATKAAERAGYSMKTARSQGQRLLTNVDIQKTIQQAIEKGPEGRGSRRTKCLRNWPGSVSVIFINT